MTRQLHDQFSKQYLKELLSPFGKVEISRKVTEEVRPVSIFFSHVSKPPISSINLGILSKILLGDCLIESFGNKPTLNEVCSCLLKLFSIQSELQGEAKCNQESINEIDLPS
jgi:hypothetical protein